MGLIWSPEAIRDKLAAYAFHAEYDPRYADRVALAIEQRAALLLRFPMLGRAVRGPLIREMSVVAVQYVLVYRIEDDAIRILRVWSTRQNREQS